MRAHNIAQEVSVAKALAAESAEEAQYLSENAIAIDFGNESRTLIMFLVVSCTASMTGMGEAAFLRMGLMRLV